MKRIYSIATVILFTFLLGACARKMSFTRSAVVPAATGSAKIKKDGNNNYTISVSVTNLAEAKNLNPARSVYVVWLETDRTGARNIGQINTSSSLFSSALKGELKATSPAKPERVFITAEDNNAVQYPGSQVVLTTQ